MGSMSSTDKNILNITQENVAVFRRRARKLYTDGDVREASWGSRVACLTDLFYDTFVVSSHKLEGFVFF
jgi:hypothetical protein